jgi:hypothetical protein
MEGNYFFGEESGLGVLDMKEAVGLDDLLVVFIFLI